MANEDIHTVGARTDALLTATAAVLVFAGVIGFSLLAQQPMLVRVGILLAGVLGGLAIAWFSRAGRNFMAFAQDAWDETRRVTWPTRKEAINVTGVVFAFVAVMAVFMFVVDKTIEWGLYDLILRWK